MYNRDETPSLQKLDSSASSKKPINVLFIAGWGRSGSTLLARILGQVNGAVSVGEARYLWDRGVLQNRLCACSAPFSECPFWGDLARTLIAHPEIARDMLALRERLRTRDLWQDTLPAARRRIQHIMFEYASHFKTLYGYLSTQMDYNLIIDSSKYPSHGYILDMLPEINLYIVHLIRDPRAVAYSWQRKKIYEPSSERANYIAQHSPARSALHWLSWNWFSEHLWSDGEVSGRYLRVLYEEFARNPRQCIEQIGRMLGMEFDLDFFVDERRVYLSTTHELSGNPFRFETGEIEIQLDEQWRKGMRWKQRLLVTTMTAPWLMRYGYWGRHSW